MHKLARRTPIAKAATWVLLGAALAVPSFGLIVRASQRWGASELEIARELPGDGLFAAASRRRTPSKSMRRNRSGLGSYRSGVAGPDSTPTPGSSGRSAQTSRNLTTSIRGCRP